MAMPAPGLVSGALPRGRPLRGLGGGVAAFSLAGRCIARLAPSGRVLGRILGPSPVERPCGHRCWWV